MSPYEWFLFMAAMCFLVAMMVALMLSKDERR